MDLYDIYTHTIDDDRCNECDEKRVKECCNKCGEGLCLNTSCCQTFPHHKNDIYIICNACITAIEQKLRPTTVDNCDLQLLKKKISKRMKANMKKLEDSKRDREQETESEGESKSESKSESKKEKISRNTTTK